MSRALASILQKDPVKGERQITALNSAEFINSGGLVSLAGFNDGIGEVGLVGRIGEVLGFEAEAATLMVGLARFSGGAPVKEVAAIELHAGCVGEYFHCASALWFFDPCDAGGFAGLGLENKVVVVATAMFKLLVGVPDTRANLCGGIEIKGGVCSVGNFAGGNHVGGDRSVVRRVQLKPMIQNIAGTFAAKIKVGVIGEADRCGLVGRCMVFNPQGVVVSEPVVDGDVEIAGVARFAIGALEA